MTWTDGVARLATLGLWSCLALSLAACATPQASGGPPGARPGASADCKAMQQQLAAMAGRGQGHGAEYRQLLDRYLARCM